MNQPRGAAPATSSRKRYECYICTRSFQSQDALKEHLTSEHSQGARQLKSSTLVRFDGMPPYKCDGCSREFPSKRHRDQHMSDNTLCDEYTCKNDYCRASFPYRCLMEKHARHISIGNNHWHLRVLATVVVDHRMSWSHRA